MHTLFDRSSWPEVGSAYDALVVGTVLFGAWTYASHVDKRKRRGLPYPPGPPRLPLIGNLRDLPDADEWIVYRDWSREHGSDLVHVDVLGNHLVVVNSAKAANDLFDKRSTLYSDRPKMTSLTEYLGFDWAVGFIPYGAKWRAIRKGFHSYFHPLAAKDFEPLEEQAAHSLLRNLLRTPGDFLSHARHMTGKVILRIAYGIDVLPQDDPFVDLAENATHSITLATSLGGAIFDTVPLLKYMPWWFPGAGFKKEAEKWRPVAQAFKDKPFAATRAAVDRGDALPSVAASIITQNACDPLLSPAQLPANFYLGGADTTATAIQNFFLAMTLYPEAQKKAQAEIDSVLGGSRLPVFEDSARLPYVSALAKEVQRWHPVVPLGIPHCLTVDDVYEGQFLPAGSIVIGNGWAILHDPDLFPDPESFRPEHYLSPSQGGTLPPERAGRATESAFGFGRRECPGRFMARSSVWIVVATVLAAFEISSALDEAGKPIPVEEKHVSGIVAYPAPFKCEIKPRSEKARGLVQATGEN